MFARLPTRTEPVATRSLYSVAPSVDLVSAMICARHVRDHEMSRLGKLALQNAGAAMRTVLTFGHRPHKPPVTPAT